MRKEERETKPPVSCYTKLIGVLVLFFFLLFSIVAIYFMTRKNEVVGTSQSRQTLLYQSVKTSPSLSWINRGIVVKTRNNEYSKNTFVSSIDKEGNFNLISPFGMTEYKCRGSCICEDENSSERRIANIALTRPVMILVAAVSYFTAVNIAKKQFEEDCSRKFSEPCFALKSEIDKCDELFENDKVFEEITEEEMKETERDEKVLHAFVSGVVQGVYFRESTRREANRIGGITGWVRNLYGGVRPGEVEVYAESRKWGKLKIFLNYIQNVGPSRSRIDKVEWKFLIKKAQFQDFTVLY